NAIKSQPTAPGEAGTPSTGRVYATPHRGAAPRRLFTLPRPGDADRPTSATTGIEQTAARFGCGCECTNGRAELPRAKHGRLPPCREPSKPCRTAPVERKERRTLAGLDRSDDLVGEPIPVEVAVESGIVRHLQRKKLIFGTVLEAA